MSGVSPLDEVSLTPEMLEFIHDFVAKYTPLRDDEGEEIVNVDGYDEWGLPE